jgi:erythromycin esterase
MVVSKGVLCLCFFIILLASGCGTSNLSDYDAFVTSVATNAILIENSDTPFSESSLESFRSSVGEAQVVGIGESRHDTHQQILLKRLLVRHLVQDMEFQVLILEESYPHAEPLDRYVTTGEGNAREILNQLAGWYLWDVEEMVELVQWIRQINETRSPDQMVRIFGMDISAPALGVRQVLDNLHTQNIAEEINASSLVLELQDGDSWPTTWQRYGALDLERRQDLRQAYAGLGDALESNRQILTKITSDQDFRRLQLLAQIGEMGNELFLSADRAAGGVNREQGMAHVVYHIMEHDMPGAKAIIWTHNLNAAKSSFRMPEFAEGSFEPMGILLNERFGDEYLSIGAAFGEGSFTPDLPPGERIFEQLSTETVDGALGAAVSGDFLLDLRLVKQDSRAATWLSVEREWRAQDFNSYFIPGDAFDMVFHVQSISRAQPTPRALLRFRSMGP